MSQHNIPSNNADKDGGPQNLLCKVDNVYSPTFPCSTSTIMAASRWFPFLWLLMSSMLQHSFSHTRGIPSVFAYLWKKKKNWKKPNSIFCLMVWNEFLKAFSKTGILYFSKQVFHFSQTLEEIPLMILRIVTSKAQTTSCDYLPKDTCFILTAFLKISPHIRIKLT